MVQDFRQIHRVRLYFYASLVIVAFGSAIFKLGYVTKVIVPDSEKAYETVSGWTHKLKVVHTHRLKDEYPKFNAFIYSLETFVPLVKLGMDDKWTIPGGAFRWYRWIHILSGWVLTTLWVGGFAGLIKS